MDYKWRGRTGWIALIAAIALVALSSPAEALDPSTGLAEAESRAASAEAEIASAEQQVDATQTQYAATTRRAEPAAAAAQAARTELQGLRAELLAQQQRASAEIAAQEASHQEEVDDHDQEVAYGIGIGLAALVGAGIALGWGRFRTSAPVSALTGIELGKALALCLGGGFLALLVGAALGDAAGLVGVMGALLVGLGLVLPIAFLLGRHSAQVQQGRSNAVSKRERLPSWVPRTTAALLLILALGGLGSSLDEAPTMSSPSPQLQEEANALTKGPGARQLTEARSKSKAAQEAAVAPLSQQRAARVDLRRATGALRGAKSLLVEAKAEQRRFTRRVEVVVAREEREATRAAEKAEREAEVQAEEEAEAVPTSSCDPNYSGCVPAYPPDVDCSEVGETVTVLGEDPHGLDADGDLSGCE